MLLDFINFFLVLASCFHLLLIGLLFKQKHKTVTVSAYIYLNTLFLIDVLAALYLLEAHSPENSLIAAKVRLIAECFIPTTLLYFSKIFSFSHKIPRVSLKNSLVFMVALGISIASLFGFIIKGVEIRNNVSYPVFTKVYWIFILFFIFILYLVFVELITKYRMSRREVELSIMREILILLLPLASLSFFVIYLLPFFNVFHPLIFLSYPIISILLFYGAQRFHVLDWDESLQHLIPQMTTASVFLFFFIQMLKNKIPSLIPWLSIPIFFGFIAVGYLTSLYFTKIFQRIDIGSEEELERKIEDFSNEIIKFIEPQQLWEYVVRFYKETFKMTRVAIVSLQYDVSPYQIEHLEGFTPKEIKEVLSSNSSPIIEFIEVEKKIVNKFEYSPDSILYQTMDRLKIYLGIPLMKQQEIIGITFLGGNRRFVHISNRYLHLLKLIGSQIAIVLENIRTIQQTVQAQKMAELGNLASQLAHDFQSFITVVKLEAQQKNRLKKHADYMEKLVQDLLNYARPQELHFSPININHLIDMSLDLVEVPTPILIEKHYAENLPEIKVDIGQMRRVFTNLLENSIRAMSQSEGTGRLKITTRPLRPLSKVQRSPWIYIEILDDGEGIPEEYLDRIFEPFFTTNKEKGGNGMGLAIVKQIITRHRGFIDVTSKPGKGTIFNIRLPYLI